LLPPDVSTANLQAFERRNVDEKQPTIPYNIIGQKIGPAHLLQNAPERLPLRA